jgi:hypothetical protein
MDDLKTTYERKLKVTKWARKWLIVPSCMLAAGLLFRSVFVGTDVLMWVFILCFNLFNYWMNTTTQKLYQGVIDSCNSKSQADRIRELNPHRK